MIIRLLPGLPGLKRIVFLALTITFTSSVLRAQNKTVSATIQADNGKLLHFVLVGDAKYQKCTFSDYVGNFTIPVQPDTWLSFRLEGYKDTTIEASKIGTGSIVILKNLAPTINLATIPLKMHTIRTENGSVAIVPAKPDMIGSRFLFTTFMHGFFTDSLGKITFNQYYLFDYEKMTGFLLMTNDNKNVLEIESDQVKSFSLFNEFDQRFDFEKVPAIDRNHYVIVLASGKKYKIYKLIKTHFVGADVAHTAGGDVGHPFDEYVDDAYYYAFDVSNKHVGQFTLRNRSIKSAFGKENDRINKFASKTSGDIDDDYLAKLGAYLNE